jgi:hypothetical protein
VKPAMRVVVVLASLCLASCTQSGSSTGSDPDASDPDLDAGMGTSSDGAGAIDASYKPCPTCCDPIAQTGCGAGEACYHDQESASLMSYCAMAGTKMVLAACVSDSECAPGFDCFSLFHNCRKFCVTDADCPSATPQCVRGMTPADPPYGICF